MSQTCPSCEAPASGRFCPQCGVAIDATCRECHNPLPAGARFCNECGVTVAAVPAVAAAAKPQVLPWAIAGVAIVALAGAVIVPRLSNDPAREAVSGAIQNMAQLPAGPEGAAGAAGMDAGSVDLASMTPRERADRLFNRVMEGMSGGDTTRIGFFTDMAIQAYGMVPERDADLHYHLGELHRAKGDLNAARAQADTLLAMDAQHLFGLFGAAQVEQARGNADGAAAFYRQFLDAYAPQIAANRPEYTEHMQALPVMRAEAQRIIAAK